MVQWRPWQCPSRVVAALAENEELPAAKVQTDNPIHRISVESVLAAVWEIESEMEAHRELTASDRANASDRLTSVPGSH